MAVARTMIDKMDVVKREHAAYIRGKSLTLPTLAGLLEVGVLIAGNHVLPISTCVYKAQTNTFESKAMSL